MEISGWHKSIDHGQIRDEQLKGARMSVYFRWAFIFLVTTLLLIQLTLGYRNESLHAFILIIVYFLSNTVLWYAAVKRYNPLWLGYLSAVLDVGVICTHLLILSLNHDQLAVTSAATLFLMPVLFPIHIQA